MKQGKGNFRGVVGVTPNYFDPDRNGAPNPAGSYYLNRPYHEALLKEGLIPVSLPYLPPGDPVDHLLDRLDGLVLTGGFDIDVRVLGGELHPRAGRVHPERLRFELDLCRKAVDRDLPVLAICLGAQTMNLAFGGGFLQHLEDQHGPGVGHSRPERQRTELVHAVAVAPGSLLEKVVGSGTLTVNSLHHQAAGDPGEGLVVSGRAEDGVVEALERPGSRFCLGVQWHPEELAADHPVHQGLFAAFAAAVRQGGPA